MDRNRNIPFDPEKRAKEKQASREADAYAIASGRKSAEQVREENGAFSFPRERMRILAYR
jgi:hypothetical protein